MPNSFKEVFAPPRFSATITVDREAGERGTFGLGVAYELTAEERAKLTTPTDVFVALDTKPFRDGKGFSQNAYFFVASGATETPPERPGDRYKYQGAIALLGAIPIPDGEGGYETDMYIQGCFEEFSFATEDGTQFPGSAPAKVVLPHPRRTFAAPPSGPPPVSVTHDFSAAPDPLPAGSTIDTQGTFTRSSFGSPPAPYSYGPNNALTVTEDTPLTEALTSHAFATSNNWGFAFRVEGATIIYTERKTLLITHDELVATDTIYTPPTP